jgi:hypothetical protein
MTARRKFLGVVAGMPGDLTYEHVVHDLWEDTGLGRYARQPPPKA